MDHSKSRIVPYKIIFAVIVLLLGVLLILKTDALRVSAEELPISGFYDYDFMETVEKETDVNLMKNTDGLDVNDNDALKG